jgi:hypothetical protein
MALARLQLDFVARRRASPWVGRILLAAALTVSADMALQYHDLSKIISSGKSELAKVGKRGSQPSRPASAAEVAAARETVQRLSLPWTKLFAAIESAATDKVALTAIEPDPRTGTVKITGDGKDYLAALTYVLNLSRAEGLSSVQLVRHETRQGSIGFTVSASWEGARS